MAITAGTRLPKAYIPSKDFKAREMSSNRKTKPSRGHSHRIFAEDSSGSGSGSGSESGLDILESTRKGLDLSQYIEGRSIIHAWTLYCLS